MNPDKPDNTFMLIMAGYCAGLLVGMYLARHMAPEGSARRQRVMVVYVNGEKTGGSATRAANREGAEAPSPAEVMTHPDD